MNALRRGVLTAALCAAVVPAVSWADAAQWPNKPIHIIVAYPGGGVSDVVARALGEKLSTQLNTPVVVENRAGAGGVIGMDAVAKAAPDGYTIGFSAISPLALTPHLNGTPFDPARDITPVVSVMYSPVLILGTTANRAASFKELLEESKASPGVIRWATAGLASLGHICSSRSSTKARWISPIFLTREADSNSMTRWARSTRCCLPTPALP